MWLTTNHGSCDHCSQITWLLITIHVNTDHSSFDHCSQIIWPLITIHVNSDPIGHVTADHRSYDHWSQFMLIVILGHMTTDHRSCDYWIHGLVAFSDYSHVQVGLPAKSGVSGVILAVIPGVMGLCMFSPPVNKNGNSVRGLHFCKVRGSGRAGGGGGWGGGGVGRKWRWERRENEEEKEVAIEAE